MSEYRVSVRATRPIWFLLAAAVVGTSDCGKSGSRTPDVAPEHGPAASAEFGRTPESVGETAQLDPWVVRLTDSSATEPALLWNGLIGIRIGRGGDGEGLPFFQIDEYDAGGEEKIRTLPNPLGIVTTANNVKLDPRIGVKYWQQLNMQSGLLTTQWTQFVGTGNLTVRTQTVIDPNGRAIAQTWRFSSADRVSIKQTNAYRSLLKPAGTGGHTDNARVVHVAKPENVEGAQVQSSFQALYRVTSTNQLCNVSTAWSSEMPISGTTAPPNADSFEVSGRIENDQPGTAEWSINYSDSPTGRLLERARHEKPGKATAAPPAVTFGDVAASSKKAWARRWQTDIAIDGPVQDQQAIHSFLFYLRSAIAPTGGMSISPFGLSDAQYNGHVFWDADVWDLPVLAFIDPDTAKAIAGYRLRRLEQARRNAGGNGVRFPWESSVTGKETAPAEFQKELHVTGSVLWGANIAAELGLIPAKSLEEAGKAAAAMYWIRGIPGKNARELRDVMSPDENFIGNNDLYTNLLASWLHSRFTLGQRGADVWKTAYYKLPKDDKSFLNYDDDLLITYKQAAAMLSVYPLQYPPAEKQSRVMMDRFESKVSRFGPAMADVVHSIVWARIGDREKAYTDWRRSWALFTANPLMLFNEKRVRSPNYFTTGAAGSLQALLFGLLGFRIDYEQEPGAAWTMKLQDGTSWLSIKPNLPTRWKTVKFKNFTVLGRRYTLTATQASATIAASTVIPGE